MDERSVLEQRVATLDGLLNTKSGSLGPAAGVLGGTLRGKWEAERRLLQRVLADTAAGDVQVTLDTWGERTAAFLEKAGDGASWTDRDGNVWNAEVVLSILIDIEERLNSWRQADLPIPDEDSDPFDEDQGG